MHRRQRLSDSSQIPSSIHSSLHCTNASHYVILMDMQGVITVRNPVPHGAFEELVRKVAVLVGSHVLFKSNDPWKMIRSYVASNLYRLLTVCSEQLLEQMDVIVGLKKMILNEPMDPKTEDMLEEVEGCQELIVSGNILVVVYYKLVVMAKTWQNRSNYDAVDVTPLAHGSWHKMIQQVDRKHSFYPFQDKFTGYLVEEAVSADIKSNSLVYKEAFSKKADILV